MALATESTAGVRSTYMGKGEFESEWTDEAEAIARALVPGESFRQFLAGRLGTEPISGTWDYFNVMAMVDSDRTEVAILVAPAVRAICAKAMTECWTVDEFERELERITEEYRPRVTESTGSAA